MIFILSFLIITYNSSFSIIYMFECCCSLLFISQSSCIHDSMDKHTRQTLCSRGQHYSLQEQTGPFKPKPETVFLLPSSNGIEQVLQELDFKTSGIYSLTHISGTASITVWQCEFEITVLGQKANFMSFYSLWRSFVHLHTCTTESAVVWFDAKHARLWLSWEWREAALIV